MLFRSTNGNGDVGFPVVSAIIATKEIAETGTNSVQLMTPERVRQAIAAIGWTFTSSQTVLADSIDIAHGLGDVPSRFDAVLVCITADSGYAVGDVIQITGYTDIPGISLMTISRNSTTLSFRSTGTPTFRVSRKDTKAQSTLTNSRWRMIMRASL